MQKLENKKRYYLIDSLRAIALINMLFFHLLYDLYSLGVIDWFYSVPMKIWQQAICISFIFISGFSFQLGRKQWKRGLIVLGGASILFIATLLIELLIAEGFLVSYGVLCFMGSAMLITVPLDLLFKRIKYVHWVGFFVSLILFVLLKNINYGTIVFGLFEVPEVLYQNYITAYFGFPHNGFFSSDYFAILPWIFLYLTGYFAFSIAKQLNLLRFLLKPRIKPLEFLGRHTLIIYILHQPMIFPIAFLISLIF